MKKEYKRLIAIILLIVEAVAVACISFVYIHWTAFRIALHHIDYQQVVPPVLVCIAALALFVFSVKKGQNKRFMFKYLAMVSLIIMVGCVITAVLSARAYCPICNYVNDDKWYPVFYQWIKGATYEPL